ncbi:MAG: GDP-L-fucose synthase [Candidatus Aureabacteria bacterium]|nr:GDP-L-fucose synthase [Candidatus Auribacterota bacterium]
MNISGMRVLVAGAGGMLGRAIVARLAARGAADVIALKREECDLREQREVREMLARIRPQVVINCAGTGGGILVNTRRPAEFFYDNLLIGTLLLHESWRAGVGNYMAFICGCCYPDKAPSPLREETLWDGYPQVTSAPYAVAKKVAAVQSEAYRRQYGFHSVVLLLGNLYGPGESFDLTESHVIPAFIRRFHEAVRDNLDEVVLWGSGAPVRDFIFVEDAAEAAVIAMEKYDGPEIINISSGDGIAVRELAALIAELSGYLGRLVWDSSRPDGQAQKVYDVTRMERLLGYRPRVSLREGITKTIEWFRDNYAGASERG